MQTVARLTTSVLSAVSIVAIALGLVLIGNHALADEPIPAENGPVRQCPNCWKCFPDLVTLENRCLRDGLNPFSLPGICATLDETTPPPCPSNCTCNGYETPNGWVCECWD